MSPMIDYPAYRSLEVQRAERVVEVTLNRPDRLNAVGDGMHEELEDFFSRLNGDGAVNAVLLTGAGRAFCVGGDVGEMDLAAAASPLGFGRGPRRLILNLLEVEVPIVVAINGDALGFGATLALFGDIVIAAESARIGDPHVRMGLVAGDGGAVIWPMLVGANRAKEYLLTGALVTATEAERIGLVNHVVADADLMADARRLVADLAAAPTWALRFTKASVNKVLREHVNLVLDASLAYEALTTVSADYREATSAFLEKRQPTFSGH
jgi:enoyl-CoA hydratase/carnithine racemase